MFYFLGDGSVPNWVANSFPIIKFIILCAIFLMAIAIVIIVLMQESEGGDSTNAITGIKDTYYKKNKGYNRDARLKRSTTILAICIAVLVVVFFILNKIYAGNIW